MSYSVDLQFTINEDFSNPQTISESGQPSAMTLQGLQASQTYYTKAVLKNDGVVEDESQMTSFQTLQAGTITLNHYQTVRSGYAYDVTYLYSSTYAPSWATLSVNGSTFQGVFDSAQHAVSFLVTGLTPGTAYLDLVTLGDIYGETGSVQGSIVTTVVNEVDITSVETAYTSADVNVEYIVDGGFYVAYVEWWLGTQDPSVDPAEGHEYFNNGAETVTISGLSEGTDYKFRASITLADQTTTIVSNVVAASTDTDYSSKYFTIKNISGARIAFKSTAQNSSVTTTIDYSIDGGTSWTTRTIATTETIISYLNAGQKLMLKNRVGNQIFNASGNFDIEGNLASLKYGDNFTSTNNMVLGGMTSLFEGCTTLIHAENAVFDSFETVSKNGCVGMFRGCSSMVTSPKRLPEKMGVNYSDDGSYAYQQMFNRCYALITVPELPCTQIKNHCYDYMFSSCISLEYAQERLPGTYIQEASYRGMFNGCVRLKRAPDIRYATNSASGGFSQMFYNCESMDTAFAPSMNSWDRFKSAQWLYGVAAEGIVYKPSELDIPGDNVDGVPEGWTTEDY